MGLFHLHPYTLSVPSFPPRASTGIKARHGTASVHDCSGQRALQSFNHTKHGAPTEQHAQKTKSRDRRRAPADDLRVPYPSCDHAVRKKLVAPPSPPPPNPAQPTAHLSQLHRDPVLTCDGHSYERSSIEAWFKQGSNTSPMTALPLPSLRLIPNHALRQLVLLLYPMTKEEETKLEEERKLKLEEERRKLEEEKKVKPPPTIHADRFDPSDDESYISIDYGDDNGYQPTFA